MLSLNKQQYGILSLILLVIVIITSIILFNNDELQRDKPDAAIKSIIMSNIQNIDIIEIKKTNTNTDTVQDILKDTEKEEINIRPQLITITVLITEVLDNNCYVGDITMSNVPNSYTGNVEFSTDGFELDFEIKEGTTVEIDYDGIMTRSIPPIISIMDIRYYGEAIDNQYSETTKLNAEDIVRGNINE